MSPPIRRNDTAPPGRPRGPSPPRRRTMSFKRLAEAQESQPVKKEQLKQKIFPVYNLPWKKLKAFLEKRFPNYQFEERRVSVLLADHA